MICSLLFKFVLTLFLGACGCVMVALGLEQRECNVPLSSWMVVQGSVIVSFSVLWWCQWKQSQDTFSKSMVFLLLAAIVVCWVGIGLTWYTSPDCDPVLVSEASILILLTFPVSVFVLGMLFQWACSGSLSSVWRAYVLVPSRPQALPMTE